MLGFMLLLGGFPPPMAVMSIMLLGMIGWIGPVHWLAGAAAERQAKIFRGLSDTLDVLAVSVNAGLELRDALQRVVDIGSEPELDREIVRTLEEIDKGGKSLRQSFEDLRDRVSLPEMTAFCNVVLMAFQIGASGMGGILMEQAEAIRRERILRAENQANTMSSKIIFPIAVFIFPAVIVTILGPMSLEAYLQFGRE
jgi:tight adherence protein C